MEGQIMQQGVEQQLRHEAHIRESEQGWSDRIGSVEQIQAKLQQRQEAAVKRERAMAYALAHQWQANSRQVPETSVGYEPGKNNWGRNWLERWMAARPWENRTLDSVEDASDMKNSGHRPQLKVGGKRVALNSVKTGHSDSSPSSSSKSNTTSSTSAVVSAKVKSATSPGLVAVTMKEGTIQEATSKPSHTRSRSFSSLKEPSHTRSRSFSSLKEPSHTMSRSFGKPEEPAHTRSRSFGNPEECPTTVYPEATKRFLCLSNSGKSTPGHKAQKPRPKINKDVNKTTYQEY